MKKAQFTSPIILILLIITYFMISTELVKIQSSLKDSRTDLLRITNDIKDIEENDLEWQSNLTSQALILLSTLNSSGTINALLEGLNASILFNKVPLLLNYTKTYTINQTVKTINGTIMVPYPYVEFVNAENNIRLNCIPVSQSCVNNNINAYMSAELMGDSVMLNHSSYPLSSSYRYIINLG